MLELLFFMETSCCLFGRGECLRTFEPMGAVMKDDLGHAGKHAFAKGKVVFIFDRVAEVVVKGSPEVEQSGCCGELAL